MARNGLTRANSSMATWTTSWRLNRVFIVVTDYGHNRPIVVVPRIELRRLMGRIASNAHSNTAEKNATDSSILQQEASLECATLPLGA
jgi:hypothetical protein